MGRPAMGIAPQGMMPRPAMSHKFSGRAPQGFTNPGYLQPTNYAPRPFANPSYLQPNYAPRPQVFVTQMPDFCGCCDEKFECYKAWCHPCVAVGEVGEYLGEPGCCDDAGCSTCCCFYTISC